MSIFSRQPVLPSRDQALYGREQPLPLTNQHHVNGHPLLPPFPANMEQAVLGMGCFWGAERRFWETAGVYITAAGYAGGYTPNPTYEEVCTGRTGHAEVVLVVFDPALIDYQELLRLFWESHDPTQGMRQGNDIGTQYRSAIYTYTDKQQKVAMQSRTSYEQALRQADYGPVTTEILSAPPFYYAEDYHQQYLAKHPHGYCGPGGTGVRCIA